MVCIIYPLTLKFGIVGASIAGTLVYFLSFILHYYYLTGVMKGIGYKVAKIISLQTIVAILAGTIIVVIKKYLLMDVSLVNLVLLLLIGSGLYIGVNLIADKNIIKNCKELYLSIKSV